ncbi:hypothetical protein [Corynebacterium comes]|uniref:Uncharacterized protein n=1 Tax=Corynebacterium comes TaxID=2675218 RepID=A0A6B8W2B6_9CORY|nr:hypothetical protein [Corynebacterium comes]QGU05565.1 hypothetical protein CETAM_11665 [Corynebacterium comes]
MEIAALRRLTGMIADRLWLVAFVLGAVGGGLVWLGVRLGLALVTIAILIVPVAVVAVFARLLRQPADRIPRWLTVLGGSGSVTGLVWLIVSPGHVPAILILAVGVWLLIVGIIASVAVGRVG